MFDSGYSKCPLVSLYVGWSRIKRPPKIHLILGNVPVPGYTYVGLLPRLIGVSISTLRTSKSSQRALEVADRDTGSISGTTSVKKESHLL